MGRTIEVVALEGLGEIRRDDDLAAAIVGVAPTDLADTDLLVVAHKVVSKAEGRVRRLAAVEPGAWARDFAARWAKDARAVQVVLDESAEILRADRGVIVSVTHHGLVCANAGVDASNAAEENELVLLPLDPDGSARRLRDDLSQRLGTRPAVLITDSFGRAWRLGQTDVAVGAAGLRVLDDWRGRGDARGRPLQATAIAAADAAAGAADLVRRKDGREPAVLVRGLGHLVTHDDGPGAAALRRPPAEDMFR